MIKIPRKLLTLALLGSVVLLGAFAHKSDGDDHPKPTNLQILPKDISHDSLMDIMHEYTHSLNVHCNFCHAKSATDPDELDFASDANGKKKVARYMMKMTAEINEKYFAEANYNSRTLMVSCYTCHHGNKEPDTLMMKEKN